MHKTLVVYSSKTGVTHDIVTQLRPHCDVLNVKDFNNTLDNYTQIVLGSGVYIGKTSKHIRKFIKKNQPQLTNKKIILFISAADDQAQLDNILTRSYGEPFLKEVAHTFHCGGEFRFEKMNKLIRFMVRKRINFEKKQGTYQETSLNHHQINALIKAVGKDEHA